MGKAYFLVSKSFRFKLDQISQKFKNYVGNINYFFSKYELVPCKDLGLMVCSIEGFILVTKVKPYSVAGEDDKDTVEIWRLHHLLHVTLPAEIRTQRLKYRRQ